MFKKHFHKIVLLFTTLGITSLQAAHLPPGKQEEGKDNDDNNHTIDAKPPLGYYNHTLQYSKKEVDNSIQPADLEDEKEYFIENNIGLKIKEKKGTVFFLMITSHKETKALNKFFFFNGDPNKEKAAIKRVNLFYRCHVISHHKPRLGPHIVFQLLGWLEQEKSKYIPVFIYASSPICITCSALIESFFHLHILSNAKGCNGLNSVDLDNICPLAQQYIKRELTFPLAKKLLLPTLRLTYEGKIKLLEQNLASKDEEIANELLKNKTLRKDIEAKTQDNNALKNENSQLNKDLTLLKKAEQTARKNLSLVNEQATKLLLEKEDLQNKHKKLRQSSRNLVLKKNKQIKSLKGFLKDRIELPCSPLNGHKNSVNSVAISSDNKYIVSGSCKTIRIWDIKTGQEVSYSPLLGHKNWVKSVAISSANRYIVSGSYKTIRIWHFKTGQEVSYSPLNGHKHWVNSVAISSDNRYIVSGSKDNTLHIWDLKTGKQLPYPLKGHTSWVNSVVVTNDNKYIISGSKDKTIRIWDLKTGKEVSYNPLTGHTDMVWSVAISSDNKYIVSGSRDNTIRIWDFKTGAEMPYSPLNGHKDWVRSVDISSDNRYIVSGSDDKTIRIWDFSTGQELSYSPLSGHKSWVHSVAISSDNTYIVSSSKDNTIRIWNFKLLRYLNEDEEKEDNEVDNEVFDID